MFNEVLVFSCILPSVIFTLPVSPISTQSILKCTEHCLVNEEYAPLCGSDRNWYPNLCALNCARQENRDLTPRPEMSFPCYTGDNVGEPKPLMKRNSPEEDDKMFNVIESILQSPEGRRTAFFSEDRMLPNRFEYAADHFKPNSMGFRSRSDDAPENIIRALYALRKANIELVMAINARRFVLNELDIIAMNLRDDDFSEETDTKSSEEITTSFENNERVFRNSEATNQNSVSTTVKSRRGKGSPYIGYLERNFTPDENWEILTDNKLPELDINNKDSDQSIKTTLSSSKTSDKEYRTSEISSNDRRSEKYTTNESDSIDNNEPTKTVSDDSIFETKRTETLDVADLFSPEIDLPQTEAEQTNKNDFSDSYEEHPDGERDVSSDDQAIAELDINNENSDTTVDTTKNEFTTRSSATTDTTEKNSNSAIPDEVEQLEPTTTSTTTTTNSSPLIFSTHFLDVPVSNTEHDELNKKSDTSDVNEGMDETDSSPNKEDLDYNSSDYATGDTDESSNVIHHKSTEEYSNDSDVNDKENKDQTTTTTDSTIEAMKVTDTLFNTAEELATLPKTKESDVSNTTTKNTEEVSTNQKEEVSTPRELHNDNQYLLNSIEISNSIPKDENSKEDSKDYIRKHSFSFDSIFV